jgi:peptidoglycan-associated lipoprotein
MNGSNMTNGGEASGAGGRSSYNDSVNSSKGKLSKNIYYFDFDKSEIHQSDLPAIYAQGDYLMAHPAAKIILEGHTDPRGSREYNVGLGERRAYAIAEVLKNRGVNPRQIRVLSYGAERLASESRTEESYQLDRRSVVVYIQG